MRRRVGVDGAESVIDAAGRCDASNDVSVCR